MPDLLSPRLFIEQHGFHRGLNEWRKALDQQLDTALLGEEGIRYVVHARAKAMDNMLKLLWQQQELPEHNLALLAVGGYGRGEMLPHSDLDILVLSRDEIKAELGEKISEFVSILWDTGFKPGISVRSLSECLEAAQDITVATTLVEARLITGDEQLAKKPRQIVATAWTDKTFFEEKIREQQRRYAQHNHTESNLEPDIKNAPGGLRDLNQIGWIAKRHFRVVRFYDLVHLGFISEFELQELESAEDFLWQVRYQLHRITGRDENRLLFDYQRDVAARLGFIQHDNDSPNHAVEQFMKTYYRVAMKISTLNEMLLAYFYESVIEPRLPDGEQPQKIILNERFELIGNKIAVCHHRVFSQTPSAIFELFHFMANQPDIIGIRAKTLRLLMLAAKTIDDNFRNDPMHRAMFMAILRAPYHLYHTLHAMKRYGVLGQYIPAFGQIIGLMQYDLFHIYTVDAHTLLLIRNLRRFGKAEFASDYPVVNSVFQRLDRKEIVYLAAIFHDIAKGRGGDHSELGAEDALVFCRNHGLSEREAKIVAWLTRNHLVISLTAQKKDISDPDVVKGFADHMGDMVHLDYLYCLTVADVNATNPKLWNSWRASLMRQLYTQARTIIRTGLDRPVDHQLIIDDTKFEAMQTLSTRYTYEQIEKIWCELGDEYFLKERADEVIWHTQAMIEHGDNPDPLVLIREHRKQAKDAAEIFIYTRDLPNLFAASVAILDQMDLNVLDARIITAAKAFSLDTYVVLDRFGTLLTDQDRQAQVIYALTNALSHPEEFPALLERRIPRQLRHFAVQTEVSIQLNTALQQNIVEIMTLDQPGLLAKIGGLFTMQGLDIHSARIATLGERAEDSFYVTKRDGQPMNREEAQAFAHKLQLALDEASQVVSIVQ
ncbi:[protein-PII] uridylyltransferase [Alkanindiges sp. WGS2144]|uniref:[protein-PII] uridylyltransferase n=1 Tax=Alkanindiges sp. WGS2144 TaxID=3366808 RepID=UPI0037522F7C